MLNKKRKKDIVALTGNTTIVLRVLGGRSRFIWNFVPPEVHFWYRLLLMGAFEGYDVMMYMKKSKTKRMVWQSFFFYQKWFSEVMIFKSNHCYRFTPVIYRSSSVFCCRQQICFVRDHYNLLQCLLYLCTSISRNICSLQKIIVIERAK